MLNAHDLTIKEVEDYMKQIFALQIKIQDKDMRIARLEFELSMEKYLLEAFKTTCKVYARQRS